jgi:crossover junction endodeoxyribonuclease RuvC
MPTVAIRKNGGGIKREYDAPAIVEWLEHAVWAQGGVAVVERQQAMPGQGVTSMFSVGLGYGLILGILAGLRHPVQVVTPQAWQKVMLAGMPRAESGKKASAGLAAIACGRLWPGRSWLATERSRKPHEGLCDAALIGLYGQRVAMSKAVA